MRATSSLRRAPPSIINHSLRHFATTFNLLSFFLFHILACCSVLGTPLFVTVVTKANWYCQAREAAQIVDCIADLFTFSVAGCMGAQVHTRPTAILTDVAGLSLRRRGHCRTLVSTLCSLPISLMFAVAEIDNHPPNDTGTQTTKGLFA